MRKLGIFVTHPVQYHTPLWRMLSNLEGYNIKVFYFSDQGINSKIDPGFNRRITWNIDLLNGYNYEFLSKRNIKEAYCFGIPNIKNLLTKENFDLILLHGYMHKYARQLIRNKKKYNYKIILRGEFSDLLSERKNIKYYFRNYYLNWFYKKIDYFCPIGKDAELHLFKRGISQDRMTTTPYSVDSIYFEPQSSKLNKKECRKQLGISNSKCVFLFSGKFIKRKKILFLLEVIQELSKEYPELAMICIGDGELLDKAKEITGMSPSQIIMPGFINQDELGKYFKVADVFVLPSSYETWGLVINEAMHFGLPCIVSDKVGSKNDLIINGVTGIIFNHSDKNDLEKCFRYFLDNRESINIMGDKAHKHIQKYSINETSNKLGDAIQKTMNTI